jgi:alkylhydroperoxidase/carboxymuconolactone decarboxylase family protein YurZ
MTEHDWTFSYEGPLHEVFPALHEAQSSWLAQIDSLQALDRKTHEIVRMVCTVALRNGGGIRRHARLAAEVGASWDEIVAAIALTQPGFGILPAAEALPFARQGYEEGVRLVGADADNGDDADTSDDGDNGDG